MVQQAEGDMLAIIDVLAIRQNVRGLRGHRGRGRCSKRRTRQPDSASATPAASPASPPPITITFFKNVLFRQAREARFTMNTKFFRLGQTHALAEDGVVQLFDNGRAVPL